MQYYSEFFPAIDESGVEGTTSPILTSTDLSLISNSLNNLVDDSVISIPEKVGSLIPLNRDLVSRFNSAYNKAVSLNLSSSQSVLDMVAAKDDWQAFLATLNTPVAWSDSSSHTDVNREDFKEYLLAFIESISIVETFNIPTNSDQIDYVDPDTGDISDKTLGEIIKELESSFLDFADDNILKTTEKSALINVLAIQESRWQELKQRSTEVTPSDEIINARNVALAARTALSSFLGGIQPSWDDTSVNSPIDRSLYQAKLLDFINALEQLSYETSRGERGTKVFIQAEEPVADVQLGDIWRKPDGSELTWYGSGSAATFQIGDDVIILGNEESPFILGKGGGWLLTATSREIASKIRTYYTYVEGDPEPVAAAVGDLWYEGPSGVTWRWSGTAWERTADRTDLNTVYFPPIPAVRIMANHLGTPAPGQLPRVIYPRIYKGGVERTGDANWSIVAGIHNATIVDLPGDPTNGRLTFNPPGAYNGTIPVSATVDGVTQTQTIQITRIDAPTPESGGEGAGPPETDDTLEPLGGIMFHVPISRVLTVTVGSGGIVQLVTNATYSATSGGYDFDDPPEESIDQSVYVAGKWQMSADGETGWTDVESETAGSVPGYGYPDLRAGSPTYGFNEQAGQLNLLHQATGLPEGPFHFRACARVTSAPPTGSLASWSGFASARPL